jgi:glycosyltransferase involved in cell wall biosynthesis
MGHILRALLRRFIALGSLNRYDLVVIEYELIPYLPAMLEKFLYWLGVKYLVDYDDAIFHRYDSHRFKLVRFFLGKKIAHVMRGASLVMVGNEYLADYARHAGASKVEIIPTVINLQRYSLPNVKSSLHVPLVISWIGSPVTAKYLQSIASALAEVCAGGRGVLRLIGAGDVHLPCVPTELIQWDDSTEVAALQQSDVGIMPLPDEPWERGKCGLKLIQYMACGLPVVGSPVGENCSIIDDGVNGFWAKTHVEWVEALSALLADVGLRQRMGSAGRMKVEQVYSTQVTGPKLVRLFNSLSTGRGNL